MIDTILFVLLIISIILNIYFLATISQHIESTKSYVDAFIDAQQSEFSDYQVNRAVDTFINEYKDLLDE